MDCKPWPLVWHLPLLGSRLVKGSVVALDLGVISLSSLYLARWLLQGPDTRYKVTAQLVCVSAHYLAGVVAASPNPCLSGHINYA